MKKCLLLTLFLWLYHYLQDEHKTYRIEKAVRKKKEGNRVLVYVKWKGCPDNFNSYVFQDEIESFTPRYHSSLDIYLKKKFRVSK